MRQDQWLKLQELEERLADVFIAEADPNVWPGHGTPSAKLSAEDRKERYQFKRAAAETAQLLVRTQALIGNSIVPGLPAGTTQPAGQQDDEDAEAESALDKSISEVERQAERMRSALIARAQKSARGKAA